MCGRAACSLSPDVIQKTVGGNGRWDGKSKYTPSFNASAGSYLPAVLCESALDRVVASASASAATATASASSSSALATTQLHRGQHTCQQRCIVSMRWGLLRSQTSKFPHMTRAAINARAETLTSKPMFRGLLRQHRAVVVVEGFYEWAKFKTSSGLETKKPYYFHSDDPQASLLYLAALYEPCFSPTGELQYEFTIITTKAVSELEWIHDRMPVILSPRAIDTWLQDNNDVDKVLAVLQQEQSTGCSLSWYPVSSQVNFMRNNHPGLLMEVKDDVAPNDNSRSPPFKRPKQEFRSPLPVSPSPVSPSSSSPFSSPASSSSPQAQLLQVKQEPMSISEEGRNALAASEWATRGRMQETNNINTNNDSLSSSSSSSSSSASSCSSCSSSSSSSGDIKEQLQRFKYIPKPQPQQQEQDRNSEEEREELRRILQLVYAGKDSLYSQEEYDDEDDDEHHQQTHQQQQKRTLAEFELHGRLPDGWRMEVKTRRSGCHEGRQYRIWRSPTGKRFRSKKQVKKALLQEGEGEDSTLSSFKRGPVELFPTTNRADENDAMRLEKEENSTSSSPPEDEEDEEDYEAEDEDDDTSVEVLYYNTATQQWEAVKGEEEKGKDSQEHALSYSSQPQQGEERVKAFLQRNKKRPREEMTRSQSAEGEAMCHQSDSSFFSASSNQPQHHSL